MSGGVSGVIAALAHLARIQYRYEGVTETEHNESMTHVASGRDEFDQLKAESENLVFQRDQAQKRCTMVEGERNRLSKRAEAWKEAYAKETEYRAARATRHPMAPRLFRESSEALSLAIKLEQQPAQKSGDRTMRHAPDCDCPNCEQEGGES